MLWMKNQIN